VVDADAVLVADRAAGGDDGLAGAALEALPAGKRLLGVGAVAEEVGGVDAAAVAVEVREVGEDVDPLASAARASCSAASRAAMVAGTRVQLTAVSNVSTA
jgi:hypothetical protein